MSDLAQSAEGEPALRDVAEAPAGADPAGEAQGVGEAQGAGVAAGAARAEAPGLGAGDAHLAAWLLLAIIDAVAIARLPWPAGGARVRWLQIGYAVGQLACVGMLAGAAADAWRRFGPRRALWGYVALSAVATALGLVTLLEDVDGLAARVAGEGKPTETWGVVLAILFAQSVPMAALLARLLSRPRLRWLALVGAAGAGIANEVILRGDYRGLHLYNAWCAATLAAVAWTGARRAPGRAPARRRGWPRLAARGVLALLAASAVVVRPADAVQAALNRADGAVVEQLVVLVHPAVPDVGRPIIPRPQRPWFQPRDKAPDVPPSQPRLLPENPVVVVVTVDSLRAEILEEERYLARLPRLRELVGRSVQFTNTRAPGSSTRNNLGSLFTGKYNAQLLWRGKRVKGATLIDDRTVRFTELIQRGGIPTVNLVSYPPLRRGVGILRGFSEETLVPATKGQDYAMAQDLIPVAVRRLGQVRAGPAFLFMHLMDPHQPYDLGGKEGEPFERYVREVEIVDRWLGELWRAIQRLGLEDRTVLVVSADHGEAFGEHGTTFHGATLYDEMVAVPLLLRVPGVPPRKVDAPVSLMDLGPTLLDLLGLSTPGAYMGQSLVGFLRGQDPVLTRPIAADKVSAKSLLVGDMMVIEDRAKRRIEIYDIVEDPSESDNLMESHDDAQDLLTTLRTFFVVHRRRR